MNSPFSPDYSQSYYSQTYYSQSWNEMPRTSKIESLVLLVLVIIGILAILVSEYKAHDCIPGKVCNHRVPEPTHDDDNLEYIDKIEKMVSNNYQYVSWRLSLLTGLIVTLPIIYFLRGRIPTFIEWLIVGGLVFFGTYLAFSWIWAHFFYPNSRAIELHLLNLRDRIHKLELNKKEDDEKNSNE